MNAADSIAYWDDRYNKAESKYEASWQGDTYMRLLELEQIQQYLTNRLSRRVLEIGCGALTLDEWPPLRDLLPDLEYTGIDASEAALNAARRSAPKHFKFIQADLSAMQVALPDADIVISRRCIQNLPTVSRERFIGKLEKFPRGLLLECTIEGMERTNQLRHRNGHEPLTEPSFNAYLSRHDLREMQYFPNLRISYPFSRYYALTRGLNIRNCPYAFRENTGQLDGTNFGPLARITWGSL